MRWLTLTPPSLRRSGRLLSTSPPPKRQGRMALQGGSTKYKSCWPIIKTEVMEAISCVWARKLKNMGVLNSAFITLLPKLQLAWYAKDYRPINLVHSFVELVTKVLANRLAGRLQEMLSPNQSTFIKKRFIQDNFMLVQQTTRFLHQQR
jgi:hypothetical protein